MGVAKSLFSYYLFLTSLIFFLSNLRKSFHQLFYFILWKVFKRNLFIIFATNYQPTTNYRQPTTNSRGIALPGFEPGLQAPEARRLDHYLTGLSFNDKIINLFSSLLILLNKLTDPIKNF